jgi:hypothetical protein
MRLPSVIKFISIFIFSTFIKTNTEEWEASVKVRYTAPTVSHVYTL